MRVLVIGDNVDIANSVADILLDAFQFGIAIEVGYESVQGISLALARRPDVVILDLDMPFTDGMTAAVAIRRAFFKNPPLLVAISENVARQNGGHLLRVFDEVFQKPLDFNRMIRIVGAAFYNWTLNSLREYESLVGPLALNNYYSVPLKIGKSSLQYEARHALNSRDDIQAETPTISMSRHEADRKLGGVRETRHPGVSNSVDVVC